MDYVFDLGSQGHSRLFRGCLFAAALLAALVTLPIARRYGLSGRKSVAWSAGNLLLGPGGIAVLVSLNELPARRLCAACSHWCPAGKLHCSHCGSALPPPPRAGREIFEPADAGTAGDLELQSLG